MNFLFALVSLMASATLASGNTFDADVAVENKNQEMTMDGTEMLERVLTYNNNREYEYSWLKKYSLRFESCHELPEYDSNGRAFRHQTMVKFRACPTGTCDLRCRGGALYAADAKDFVPVYLESRMSFSERTCQHHRNQCKYSCHQKYYGYNNNNNNNNNNLDSCTSSCLSNAGYESCYLDRTIGEINIENYLECSELPHMNAATGRYYFGKIYCGALGGGMFLGVYEDSGCSRLLESGGSTFFDAFGIKMPFGTTSIVSHDCVSCLDNSHNYYDAVVDDVIYNCESLYSRSLKCENRRFLDVVHPNKSGCRFIKRTLPYLDDINRGSRRMWFSNLLAIFFGICLFYCCVVACMLGKKRRKELLMIDD